MLPIGPLLASNRQVNSTRYFWQEDSACLEWLDQQQPNSVIYVAFGSFTVIDKIQFQELALGLELSNKPFLWVVRPDITDGANEAFPDGFEERVANRGKMVVWAPQQKVLSHPSIACFFSHCGWNSTVEGLSNGLPFLCWPYFADQFIDESYICDVWKVGLRFKRDESGIITREEIKNTDVSVLPIYRQMIPGGLRVWVFSGDVDSVVPVTATRYSLAQLKLTTKIPGYPWYVKKQIWLKLVAGLLCLCFASSGNIPKLDFQGGQEQKGKKAMAMEDCQTIIPEMEE
ncbi:hypothetical protein Patl1_21734 [Pistacia atlantica]|uniref:Uncharacterized protein n=1 Tax=Pistacia atlantica TaxID=434234 RepID=A0ACC1BNV7_9ROSI|nr:hypothetical protein Patl1_21734 [Pistacia atlantica]